MALLLQNQAALLADHRAMLAEHRVLERETAERFARIESLLLEQGRILRDHTRLLEALPEAVRETVGFRPGPPQSERQG